MDNEMYRDEFEQFLQDEVKQHRMYPSDHVWKNIRTDLHGYRSWPALTFISLFIITALTVSTLLSNHSNQAIVPPVTSLGKSTTASNNIASKENYFTSITPEKITASTFADLSPVNESENTDVPPTDPFNSEAETTLVAPSPSNNFLKEQQPTMDGNHLTVLNSSPAQQLIPQTESFIEEHAQSGTAEHALNTSLTTFPTTAVATEEHATADDFLKDFKYVPAITLRNRYSKFGIQFYITPSTSYRKLSDQKLKEINQPAIAAASTTPQNQNYRADVNSVVRHRPAVGMEVGFALLYNISDRLKFKTGVQLNIRQYYIETFQSYTHDQTTLSLINSRGVENVVLYSPYNNNVGYKETQLDNKQYQLSIPIGLQWELIKGKHFGINTEASVQPTFNVTNNVYLLSTDYKHYTDGSNFLRKWNINTSVGLNISYRSGLNSWQIGPQVRYQHLPTYSNLYPIKEYLLDYGVRIGLTRQFK